MADVEDARKAWLSRVLGFTLAPRPTKSRLATWNDARRVVDDQITKLQQHLRSYDDEDLRFVAEFGLLGVFDGVNVKLMAALFDDGAPRSRERTIAAVAAYEAALNPNKLVDLLEANPFSIDVSIRATLGGALTAIRESWPG